VSRPVVTKARSGDDESSGYGRRVADGIDEPEDQDDLAEPDDAAVRELERLLLTHGPLTVEALAEHVAAELPGLAAELAGDEPDADLVEELTFTTREADEFWRLPDGRLAPVLHHLRRATFTHRLTAAELEREAVDLCPDLVALALPRSVVLASGSELRTADGEDDARGAAEGSLLGPPGWLADLSAGDLVAVRYDGEAAQLERITGAELDDAAARTLSDALARAFGALPGDRAPEAHQVVVDTMGTDAASFAVPVAPLTELLQAAGLQVREAWVGPAGRPWQTPAEQARRRHLDQLLTGAEGCCRQAARQALDAWHAWMAATGEGTTKSVDEDTVARVAQDIDHGPTAPLLAELATLGRSVPALRGLGGWAAVVAESVEEIRPGVEYLRAVGADAAGDGPAVEAHLQAGLGVEADDPACLSLLAELVQDRGDAERSLALLRRAGRPPSPEVLGELRPFLVDRQVGRNEPCPCGSGRKYKTCCWGRPIRRPLPERCRWLLAKATRHAVRMHALGVDSLRRFFATSSDEAQATALAEDMLLFTSGGLARYLASRGPFLPDDELACAQAWPGRPMRLLEVVAIVAGGRMEAVDLRTGEQLTVVDPSQTALLAVGDTVLARPLPVEEQWLLGRAVIAVPPAGRDGALRMVEHEVRPIHLIELLVDLQVEAIRAGGLGVAPPALPGLGDPRRV
jgi:SEC-C motif